MSLGDDDGALLETYCDNYKLPSVKEYLDKEYPTIEQRAKTFVEKSTIFIASKSNDLLSLKIFVLILKANIESKSIIGDTALQYASNHGHLDVVEFLVSEGCNVNNRNRAQKTALHFAAKKGSIDIVKFLVGKGCDVKAKDFEGKNAYCYAVEKNQTEVFDFLKALQ